MGGRGDGDYFRLNVYDKVSDLGGWLECSLSSNKGIKGSYPLPFDVQGKIQRLLNLKHGDCLIRHDHSGGDV